MGFRKKFITAVAVTLFALAPSRTAQAQWIVSDPTNLTQAILQFIQDATMEGDFGDISKLAEAKQAYTDLKNRLDEVKELKAVLSGMGKVGRQLEEITAFGKNIATTGENLSLFVDYFSKSSNYSSYANARTMYNLYNEVSSDILLEMNELFKTLTNMKQGAGMIEYVDAITQVTSECNSKLGTLQKEVSQRMIDLLNKQENRNMYEANSALLKKTIL